jgi:hypothetical protein
MKAMRMTFDRKESFVVVVVDVVVVFDVVAKFYYVLLFQSGRGVRENESSNKITFYL